MKLKGLGLRSGTDRLWHSVSLLLLKGLGLRSGTDRLWHSVSLLLLTSSHNFPPEYHQNIYYSGISSFQKGFLVHDASWEQETEVPDLSFINLPNNHNDLISWLLFLFVKFK